MINLHAVFLKKAAGLIIYFFWVGLWLLGLGLVLWYPLRWWPGDKLLPVQLINYFMPWLLLALIPAIIIAGLANRPGLIALLTLPTLFIIFSYAPLFLPRSNMVLADSGRIKVMSYNIWGRNHNMRSVAAIIHREQPDILLLQEAYSHLSDSLMEELTRLYPDQELYYTFTPGAGQAIISRFPFRRRGPLTNRAAPKKPSFTLLTATSWFGMFISNSPVIGQASMTRWCCSNRPSQPSINPSSLAATSTPPISPKYTT